MKTWIAALTADLPCTRSRSAWSPRSSGPRRRVGDGRELVHRWEHGVSGPLLVSAVNKEHLA
jgi:hypothetical protein